MYQKLIMIVNIVGAVGSLLGGVFGILAFVYAINTYKQSVKQERVRATLADFPAIRKEFRYIKKDSSDLHKRRYISALEYFSVGVNENAYDIDTVCRMSGNLLLRQYDDYLKSFVDERRRKTGKTNVYIEYEKMMELVRGNVSLNK